jgi:hypothetical protein
MNQLRRRLLCVVSKLPAPLGGGQTIILVVVLVLGAALALAGMPVVTIVEVLTATGLVGTHLVRRAPLASDAG